MECCSNFYVLVLFSFKQRGDTALTLVASTKGDKEVAESLLSAGADAYKQTMVCDIYDCCDEYDVF